MQGARTKEQGAGSGGVRNEKQEEGMEERHSTEKMSAEGKPERGNRRHHESTRRDFCGCREFVGKEGP